MQNLKGDLYIPEESIRQFHEEINQGASILVLSTYLWEMFQNAMSPSDFLMGLKSAGLMTYELGLFFLFIECFKFNND